MHAYIYMYIYIYILMSVHTWEHFQVYSIFVRVCLSVFVLSVFGLSGWVCLCRSACWFVSLCLFFSVLWAHPSVSSSWEWHIVSTTRWVMSHVWMARVTINGSFQMYAMSHATIDSVTTVHRQWIRDLLKRNKTSNDFVRQDSTNYVSSVPAESSISRSCFPERLPEVASRGRRFGWHGSFWSRRICSNIWHTFVFIYVTWLLIQNNSKFLVVASRGHRFGWYGSFLPRRIHSYTWHECVFVYVTWLLIHVWDRTEIMELRGLVLDCIYVAYVTFMYVTWMHES